MQWFPEQSVSKAVVSFASEVFRYGLSGRRGAHSWELWVMESDIPPVQPGGVTVHFYGGPRDGETAISGHPVDGADWAVMVWQFTYGGRTGVTFMGPTPGGIKALRLRTSLHPDSRCVVPHAYTVARSEYEGARVIIHCRHAGAISSK